MLSILIKQYFYECLYCYENLILDHLLKNEFPGKIYLCDEIWTSESGLLTEAMKLKRRQIKEKYEQIITKLYRDDSYRR